MNRRVLLFREPLRRRPYGEKPFACSHARRREGAARPVGTLAPRRARPGRT